MENKKTVRLKAKKHPEGINLLPETEKEVHFEPFLPEDAEENVVEKVTDMLVELNPIGKRQTESGLTIAVLLLLNVALLVFFSFFLFYVLNLSS